MNRFPRSKHSHAQADDGVRQVIIVVTVIACVLGLGALATDQYLEIAKRQSAGTFEPANGKGIYTGSVVYMPETGNVCHQWQFNNLNGQFSDKGAVDCNDEGLEGPKNWSTARIRVISDGFRDH